MEALEGLELVIYAGGEGADGDVTDIAEEVLDADLFSFLGFDYGGCMDECFCRGCAILDYPHQPILTHPFVTRRRDVKIKVKGSKHTSLISSTAK